MVDIKLISLRPILSSIIVIIGEKHIEVNVIIGLKKYPSFISTEGDCLYFKYDIKYPLIPAQEYKLPHIIFIITEDIIDKIPFVFLDNLNINTI
jgi:hypothetical protein